MTVTHKNQVGQDSAGVNGGEFAKKVNTGDTVQLTPNRYDTAFQAVNNLLTEQSSFNARMAEARTELVRATIAQRFPDAATAVIVLDRGWSNQYRIDAILDAENTVIWSFDDPEPNTPDRYFVMNTSSYLEEVCDGTDLASKIPVESPVTEFAVLLRSKGVAAGKAPHILKIGNAEA